MCSSVVAVNAVIVADVAPSAVFNEVCCFAEVAVGAVDMVDFAVHASALRTVVVMTAGVVTVM